jgi:1-deoxy-D-xylulose-5-phosphate synthase
LPDWYIEQGPQDLLREKYGLTADGIAETVKAFLDQLSTGTGMKAHSAAAGASFRSQTTRSYLPEGDEQGS